MTKQELLNRFKDMVDTNLELIKDEEYHSDYTIISEVLTVVWTAKNLSELSENEMEKFIKNKTGYSLDDLQDIENNFL